MYILRFWNLSVPSEVLNSARTCTSILRFWTALSFPSFLTLHPSSLGFWLSFPRFLTLHRPSFSELLKSARTCTSFLRFLNLCAPSKVINSAPFFLRFLNLSVPSEVLESFHPSECSWLRLRPLPAHLAVLDIRSLLWYTLYTILAFCLSSIETWLWLPSMQRNGLRQWQGNVWAVFRCSKMFLKFSKHWIWIWLYLNHAHYVTL